MNSAKALFTKSLFTITILLFCSATGFAQTKYKVVCDKTDNTIKVVEAQNLSANYVPIKGGFPFRQIAEQWISDNFTTKECNPEDVADQMQTKQNTSTQANKMHTVPSSKNPQTTAPPPSPQQPQARRSTTPRINYRNSSIIFHGKFSNLGDAFYLSESMMPGFEVGFEQLFGKQGYFGTGITGNFFFSDMDGWNDSDLETIYFFRIPAFGGYRIQKRMFVAMFEAGGALNTSLRGTPLTLDTYGLSSENMSFNFLIRAKVGFPGIMFELGYDTWLTDVFVDDSFRMSAITMGIRVSF